jgi:hypothetical protein
VNRPAFLTGLVLLLVGLALFLWKAVVLDMPVLLADSEGLWRVEIQIDARGTGGRGSLRLALPSSDAAQAILDDRALEDDLSFSEREEDGQRVGVWSGAFRGIQQVTHGFRVQFTPPRVQATGVRFGRLAPPELPALVEPEITAAWGGQTPVYPIKDASVTKALETLGVLHQQDLPGRTRTLFGFVSDEVQTLTRGSEDALLTLARREGGALGKVRLLITLLRAAGIPARPARGLLLDPGPQPLETTWVEARLGGSWIPMGPVEGWYEATPPALLHIASGETPLLRTTGLEGSGYRWRALREELSSEELAALMSPPSPLLQAISLYRLPLDTQGALRLLLLFPLGALLTALLRNIVGLHTFGTFLPILVAFSLRGTGLELGLFMFTTVVAVGYVGRLLLERLRLLMVPRVCIELCLVILLITGFSLTGRGLGERELFSGVLFPIVIMAMLIERFAIAASEQGHRAALARLGWTAVAAVLAYPIFRGGWWDQVMLGYPELVLCIMGLLVWIGSYTGFRAVELVRFRSLAFGHAGAARP